MNPLDSRIDARMRALFTGIDTSPEFQTRVMQRIVALGSAPCVDLRAQFERRRELVRRRLRREAWSNAAAVAGIGAAAIALVWRHGPVVARWVEGGLAVSADPGVLTGAALAVLAAGLWPVVRRFVTPL